MFKNAVQPQIIRQLRDNQRELTEHIAVLREDEQEAQTAADRAEQEANVLTEQIDRNREAATDELHELIITLNNEVYAAEQTLKEKRAEEAVLVKEKRSLEDTIVALHTEITTLHDARDHEHQVLEMLRGDRRAMQESVNAAKAALQGVYDQIEATRKERDAAFTETDTAKEARSQEEQALANTIKSRLEEESQLQALIAYRHGLNEREKFIKAKFAQLGIRYR